MPSDASSRSRPSTAPVAAARGEDLRRYLARVAADLDALQGEALLLQRDASGRKSPLRSDRGSPGEVRGGGGVGGGGEG